MLWFDSVFLADIRRNAQADFDSASYSLSFVVGAIGLAASVMVLAALAWWSRSSMVGIGYLLAGTPLLLAPVLFLNIGSALPVGLMNGLADLSLATSGPMSAGIVLGAASVLAGIVAVSRSRTDAAPAG